MTGNTKDQIGKLLTEKSREFSGNNRIELTAKNIGDDLYISRNLASQYLNHGTVKTAQLISHRVPLGDYEKAFELAETPGNYRVSLMP